jgi:hypothetical protein|nr:MAG TPA: hypothetical protein [Caudoviricetes sp.]
MSDNYAVINGKRVELTDEQVKALGVESVETKINPFNRMGLGSYYYAPHFDGTARTFTEDNSMTAILMHRNCSYFNDKDFAKQIALHQLLYRKLLKFSYDNGCEDTAEWNGANEHWLIIYHKLDDDFTIMNMEASKELSVFFSTEEGASRAITEVIRPFMKEHPDFVW